MKLLFTLAIVLALVLSTQAKVQSGQVSSDYWGYAIQQEKTFSYYVTFPESFTSTPNIVLAVNRLDLFYPNEMDFDWSITYDSVSSTGFQVYIKVHGYGGGHIYQIIANYVAYTQTVAQFQTGKVQGSFTNGQVQNIAFNLVCPSGSIEAASFIGGMYNPAGYVEWTLSTGTPSLTSNGSGSVSGTVPIIVNFPTYTGTMNNVLIYYIVGCAENIQIVTNNVGNAPNYIQYVGSIENFNLSLNEYGILPSASSARMNPTINTRMLVGYKADYSLSNGYYSYQAGTWDGSGISNFVLTDVILAQSECDSTCSNCSNGVCTQCINSYILQNGSCVSQSSFIYWYVNGYDYEKIIGKVIDGYTPGQGYFVWASTYCQTTFNQNGVDYTYETNQSEGFWQWIEGGVNTVTDQAAPLGYWVRDYTIDDEWWQPAQFDPENPQVNWNTWAWLLEWILTYSKHTYTDEITLEELTEMAGSQRYVYTSEEIQYVFNVIGNYDEGISYGDILTTIIEIQYGDYAQRVIGAC